MLSFFEERGTKKPAARLSVAWRCVSSAAELSTKRLHQDELARLRARDADAARSAEQTVQNQRLNMVRMFGSKREFQVQKFVRNRKGRTLSQDESERRHSALDGGHGKSVSSAVSTHL